MKRLYALGLVALLAVALLWLVPGDGPLVGSWEATVELPGGENAPSATAVRLRYTFRDDGTYICRVSAETDGAEAQSQGNYKFRGDRLYLSAGLDYPIDQTVYDRCRLEGNTLTLLDNVQGDMAGFYPLTLTRCDEN